MGDTINFLRKKLVGTYDDDRQRAMEEIMAERNPLYEKFGFDADTINQTTREAYTPGGQSYMSQLRELRDMADGKMSEEDMRRLKFLELLYKADGMFPSPIANRMPLGIPPMMQQPERPQQFGPEGPNLPAEEWNSRSMPGLMDWFDRTFK